MIAVALRERLGEDATHADLRLEHLASREDLVEGFAGIAKEIGNIRVELLRWSFAFWIGQVGVTTALMALLFRLLTP